MIRIVLYLSIGCFVASSVQAQQDSLFTIVEKELKREMNAFSEISQGPYFLAYRINDMEIASLGSSFGSLTSQFRDRARLLVTDVRVGDYQFDNTHTMEDLDDMPYDDMIGQSGVAELPYDNRAEAIQVILWQQTQNAYRASLSMLKALKNSSQRGKPTTVADFSKEKPEVYIDEPLIRFADFYDKAQWEDRIKKYSAPFLTNEAIVEGDASLEVGTERKYFISSEGSRIAQNRTYAHLSINTAIRADDGDIVPLHTSFYAEHPSQLPKDEDVMKAVSAMLVTLGKLKTAPLAEPYTGPAILHAKTAGVFFHEIFGHRVEGHRLKHNTDGQTFKGKVNELVLPSSVSIVFDPTRKEFNGQALNGHYLYDDEGVKARPVTVVEKGMLKSFLMSRTPIENFSQSNGHGRAEAGAEAVARQSNLLITNEKPVKMTDLRKMLIAECKKQKKSYGYLFMEVVGGFTTTDRYMPNAFNIFPTEVYRIYADGRPDELVRGVDLIGTPLAMFAEIKATDDQAEVFTGFCGAESGSVPVSATSPSLFVKRIETQKKPVVQVDKPLVVKPAANQ